MRGGLGTDGAELEVEAEGAPDPGCEFTDFTSPKIKGEKSKIILFNENDESEWSSVITNHDNSHLNKTRFFRTLFLGSKHLLKIIFFYIFFISDSTVSRKIDHFEITFTI